MKIDSISYADLGERDRSVWRELLSAHPIPNPLNDPDYLQCLSNAGRNIEVLIVSEDDRKIIYWPFEKNNKSGLQPVALPVSDCSQFIEAKDISVDPAEILRRAGVKSYDFDHLFHQNSFDANKYSYFRDPCFMIRLGSGFDAYLNEFAARGSRLVAEARRKLKKMEREIGPVRFEPCTTNRSHLQTMLDWKVQQLDEQGVQHCFREEWAVRFMHEHLELKSDHCEGKLSVLFANDQPVAMHYGSWGYGSINSWLPAVSPIHAKYSPALNLYLELIRHAVDQGLHSIILGRGENQTKTRLANFAVDNYVGSIPTGIFGKTRLWGTKRLYGILRSNWGKYLREKMRGKRN